GFAANDRLQVWISTDCAETFDVLWDMQGTSLHTAGVSDALFVPGASDWETTMIDLSDYIGQEVNVQFKAITDWGNNCWLDNINLTRITSTRELLELTGFEMFPNPADAQMTVRFNLEQTTQMEVGVYNALGQRVQTVATENFAAGRHTLEVNTADLSEGVYFLRLRNADRETSQRFIVNH
ncbi:MAG: T9SS type A sorting domain-containing protein, partial [Lewinella sp.]|nr:T9SS type A sorting domain-containing protein [Lewinella sp.]